MTGISTAYVALALGGVQEFIAASRRTADLWAGSRIMSTLCGAALDKIKEEGGTPILPAGDSSGRALPNRLFAEVPAGRAAAVAAEAAGAVRAEWGRLVAATQGAADDAATTTAGFPVVRWVVGEPTLDGTAASYTDAWRLLGAAMEARKRVRDFPPTTGAGGELCALCGMRDGSARARARRFRVAHGERLCPVCAVKRDPMTPQRLGEGTAAFPSTASVASAPFRARVVAQLQADGEDSRLAHAVAAHRAAVEAVVAALRALGADSPGGQPLRDALPGLESQLTEASKQVRDWARLEGAWCYQDTWQPEPLLREHDLTVPSRDPRLRTLEEACKCGRHTCQALYRALRASNRGPAATDDDASTPATYLALLAQDADDMGRRLAEPDKTLLAGRSLRYWHREVSTSLGAAAEEQTRLLAGRLGRAVYAGGDDLLGLIPAAHALDAAGECYTAFQDRTRSLLGAATASTAVLFFHYSYPLQEALRRTREALRLAKDQQGKDRLAVMVVRRGGERAAVVRRWTRRGAMVTKQLTDLTDAFRGRLSPRLLADMHRERQGIAELAVSGEDHRAEITRLVTRHHGGEEDEICRHRDLVTALEPAPKAQQADAVTDWVAALEVARFLAQEGR